MKLDLDKFIIKESEKGWAVPTLEIVLVSFEPLKNAAEAITQSWKTFERHYGNTLTFFVLNDSTRTRKVKMDSLNQIPFWMTDKTALNQTNIGVEFHSGKTGEPFLPPAFGFFYDQSQKKSPTGIVKFALPPEMAADFDTLWQMIQEAFSEFPLAWGYGGYSFYWRPGCYDEREIMQKMRPLLLRHPGIEIGDEMTLVSHGRQGFFSINWLNFVGKNYMTALGGKEQLKSMIENSDLSLLSLGSQNVVIKAGDAPQVGDRNRGDDVSIYRATAKILEPIWIKENGCRKIWINPMPDIDEAQQWLCRFFVDRD